MFSEHLEQKWVGIGHRCKWRC